MNFPQRYTINHASRLAGPAGGGLSCAGVRQGNHHHAMTQALAGRRHEAEPTAAARMPHAGQSLVPLREQAVRQLMLKPAGGILGGCWLGETSLWGSAGREAMEPWDRREAAGPAQKNLPGGLGLVVLRGLMESGAVTQAARLFLGIQPSALSTPRQDDAALAIAFLRHGSVENRVLQAGGAVGGLELAAMAQAAPGPAEAVCLAAVRPGVAGQLNETAAYQSAAAAMALALGQETGGSSLGRVCLDAYAGPPDSGAQADFLENLGRLARGREREPITAVIMNRPGDPKWRASLDAAARRAAPRARRYGLPVEPARAAGGLILVMAAASLPAPRQSSPRLVLAVDDDGRAAALRVSFLQK